MESSIEHSCTCQHGTGHSVSSTESDILNYKEKIEHFKFLIRKLQDENESYKIRKEGAETVSKLLQESKQQIVSTQKKVKSYESVIRILQSRLENNRLPSDITLQEGEEFIPGHSKNLLDNLTRENTRLRNLVRNNSGDPEQLALLQQHISETTTVNANLQTRVAELEQVLRASDNDKDKTITKLREELQHAHRELNSRTTLCTTLAEQTEELQRQLQSVAQQCQDLVKRLQEQGKQETGNKKVVDVKQKSSVKLERREDAVDAKYQNIRQENDELKLTINEITEMNKRWQTYNNERDAFVKHLQLEINQLKTRESTTQANNGDMAQEVAVQMNKVLDEARSSVNKAEEERNKTRRELEQAKRQLIDQSETIQKLKRGGHGNGHHVDAETIDALKAQIQICTEDFESERKDREKAQTRLGRMETEMEHFKKENEALKRERLLWQSSQQSQFQYVQPDPHYHYNLPGPQGTPSSEGLAARGIQQAGVNVRRNIDKYNVIDGAVSNNDAPVDIERSRGVSNDNAENTEDNYQSLRTSSISSGSKEHSSMSPRASPSPRNSQNSSRTNSIPLVAGKISDILKCPKCDQEYSSEDHAQLLEHLEFCCEM